MAYASNDSTRRTSTRRASSAATTAPQTFIYTPTNTRIHTASGDITQASTDAIVSPNDRQLRSGGGAAKVLVQAAGEEIRVECSAYVQTHGELQVSGTYVTNAGNLQAKVLIHAVGPTVRRGREPNATLLRQLHDTFTNSLTAADEHDCQSITIPAIGTGYGGFSLELAAEEMVGGVLDFLDSRSSTSLTDIHLLDINAMVVSLVASSLLQHSTDRPEDLVAQAQAPFHTQTSYKRSFKKLQQQVNAAGLKVVDQPSNGDCQYLAVAHQVLLGHGREVTAGDLRADAVQYLIDHPCTPDGTQISEFVTGSWDKYLQRMSQNRYWGDHITLQALANVLNCDIKVYKIGSQSPDHIQPYDDNKSIGAKQSTLTIGIIQDNRKSHYVSLVPAQAS